MKIKIIVLTIIACLMVNLVFAQSRGYTISGHIRNLPDGVTFYLILNKESGGADTIDRTKSKGQQFIFNGRLEDKCRLAFVKIDTSIVKLDNNRPLPGQRIRTWIRLLLDNSGEIVKIVGDVKDWPKMQIEGSKLTKEYDQFVSSLRIPIELFNQTSKQAKRDSASLVDAQKTYDLVYLKNLKLIADSYAVPLFLFNYAGLNLDLKEGAYQKLSDKLKNSYYGRRLKQQIVQTRASKNICIGKVIPDFQVKTVDGRLESIRKIAKKSKYTLVDFWASWCAPCRADIPNMKMVYNAFGSKGFNILSISTDTKTQNWIKALKEENTSWDNGIQENRESDSLFGLISIPAYILLNEKAEIVQMDLNSRFFGPSAAGTMNGTQVFIKDSKKKGLRGDDLYEVIEGLLDKPDVK